MKLHCLGAAVFLAAFSFKQCSSTNRAAETHIGSGSAKEKAGDLDGAMEEFDQAIAADPKNAIAFFDRSNIKFKKDNKEGALADLDEAIRLNPKLTSAYFNRGNLRRDLKDPVGAIADFDRAVALDPRYAGAINNRGLVKQDRGKWDAAEADFHLAITVDPKNAMAYNNLGRLEGYRGNWAKAVEYNRKAVELNPASPSNHINLGLAYFQLKHNPDAEAECIEAIKLDPARPEAYLLRGRVRWAQKDAEGASADFTKAIELKPENDYFLTRAVFRKETGNLDGAIEDLDRAIAEKTDSFRFEAPGHREVPEERLEGQRNRLRAFGGTRQGGTRLPATPPLARSFPSRRSHGVCESRGSVWLTLGRTRKGLAGLHRQVSPRADAGRRVFPSLLFRGSSYCLRTTLRSVVLCRDEEAPGR